MDSIEVYRSKLGGYSKFLFDEICNYFRYKKKIYGNRTCMECVLQSLIEGTHRTYCCKSSTNDEPCNCRYYKNGIKPCGNREVFTWLN